MLTCRETSDLITDFLEGRLTLARRLRFHLHVGMCRHCRTYLRQMRAVVRALGLLPPEPVPLEIPQELLRRLRGWRR
ncbi:MAG: anti-sigma factor family protein [Candidatus Polarisedimenticolia bacterium]